MGAQGFNRDENLELARDPATTPERLREVLARCDQAAPRTVWAGTRHEYARSTPREVARVREALASNPSSPVDMLLDLSIFHLAAVLNNAAMPLLLLEQPLLFEPIGPQSFAHLASLEAPDEAQLRVLCPTPESIRKRTGTLLSLASTPPDFFASMRLPEQVSEWRALASHPNAPVESIARCLTSWASDVRRLAAQHPRAPSSLIERLRRAGATGALEMPPRLPAPLPDLELRSLLQSGEFSRMLAAINPALDPEVEREVGDLEGTRSGWRKGVLADATLTSDEIHAIFSVRGAIYGREAELLAHPATPPSILERLDASSPELARLMAAHPGAPPSQLARCLTHELADVRRLALEHPQAPAALIASLREAGASEQLDAPTGPCAPLPEAALRALVERGVFARMLAALNPNATEEMLTELAGAHHDVSAAVLRHPRATAAMIEKTHPSLWQRDERPRPGPLLTEEKISDYQVGVPLRQQLARHPLTPPWMLAKLANDRDFSVRAAVATHPSLPPRALTDLGLDDHPSVIRELLRNSALPSELIDLIVRYRPPALIALRAARHPNASRWALRALLASDHEEARAAAQRRLDEGY